MNRQDKMRRYDFDIVDYGAMPDGRTLCTDSIQHAIDACHETGGGVVRCGPGTFLTGSLMLKSRVELHLAPGCLLRGSESLDDYPDFTPGGYHPEFAPENSSKCLIGAADAEDIAITGPGRIDASGRAFYGQLRPERGKYVRLDTPRPRLIMFYRCRHVRMVDTALLNSSCWTVWLMQCRDVHVHRIRIDGDRHMQNHDGIDIDACRDVTVSDCILRTEDDSIILRAIQQAYDDPAVCENVTVTNCMLTSTAQGIRVGCPSDGVIRHCTFSNLVIDSTKNGINFDNPKRYLVGREDDRVDISDISFDNVTVRCEWAPIRVWVDSDICLKRLAGLRFSNFRIRSGRPCMVIGSPLTVVRDVAFNGMTIETRGEQAIECRHCAGVRLNDVELAHQPDVDKQEGSS